MGAVGCGVAGWYVYKEMDIYLGHALNPTNMDPCLSSCLKSYPSEMNGTCLGSLLERTPCSNVWNTDPLSRSFFDRYSYDGLKGDDGNESGTYSYTYAYSADTYSAETYSA